MSTKNNQKTNETVNAILTTSELKKLFTENGILPKYSDNSHYVGCGTRANVFSVNSLKKQYNVYCSNDIFKLFDGKKYNDCEFTANGNSTDKTRPNTIIVKSTDTLKKLLAVVLENNTTFAIDK
jgi:hypothetical protein